MNANNSYKQIATDFLMTASRGKPRDAFGKYVADQFKHHNIYFKGDAESLIQGMEEAARKNPEKVCAIKRIIQEEHLVAVHSHVYKSPGDPGAAVIHIFRFENDKIVELWDFGQPVPATTINENGMF